MGKHLLDETAEFKMPRLARHAAEDEDGLDATQRFDPGFRQQPAAAAPKDPAAR